MNPFCPIPPVVPVTTAGDSPDDVAFFLFGFSRAVLWTIDLDHVQLDVSSPFS